MRKLAIISTAMMLFATTASALTLMECRRITHISHGGEYGHRDLGEGRVMWTHWWTQEGSYKGYALVECATGETLSFRAAEENMGPESAFDRTDDVREVLERHQSGSRVFATFERIAADLAFMTRDLAITTETTETCACAAAYPELRGDKTEFVLAG
jgi:hypothetical protein